MHVPEPPFPLIPPGLSLPVMAHKRTHHKLTKSRPIPCSRTVLTGHRHAQSDCGHGSTQSRRSRSLLRNFSLRSLRKSRHQDDVQPPWPQLALAPSSPSSTGENITDTGSAPSQSSSCSSGVNASLRVRSALYHQDAMSSPLTGGPGPGSAGGIRSLFLPFETVSRLVGPLWSLPSSEDSSCVSPPLVAAAKLIIQIYLIIHMIFANFIFPHGHRTRVLDR